MRPKRKAGAAVLGDEPVACAPRTDSPPVATMGAELGAPEQAAGSEADCLVAALKTVTSAFDGVDSYAVARDAKRKQRDKGIYLDGIQYGEINPVGFAQALAWVEPQAGEVFFDLGSGVGVAVLAAAALHPFKRAIGVEIVRELHDQAVHANGRLVTPLQAGEVKFVHGDALAAPWHETGDVVFCTTSCFTDEMRERLVAGAERLTSGSRLIVTSQPIKSKAFQLLKKEALPYGQKGGMLTFFAYRRR